MIKKIMIGVLLAGVIGLLVFGAINRTNVKTGGETALTGNGGGRWSESGGAGETVRGGGRAATGGGRWQNQVPLAEENIPAAGLTTLNGAVESVDAATLTVRTTAGELVEIGGQPWAYARQAGFQAKVGDQLALTGFPDSATGRFETTQIRNQTSGTQVTLRDSLGRPMWAGRGGRG